MNLKSNLCLIATISAFLCNRTTYGVVLVSYDFSGLPVEQATYVDPALTSSNITRSAGLVVSGGGGVSSRGFTTTNALTGYYEYTMTPDFGNILNLDTFLFSEKRTSNGIRDFSIRTSLDSFSSDIYVFNVPDDLNFRDHVVNFTSVFDAISNPLTIRLYGYNAEAVLGTWTVASNSSAGAMEITGTVVPEPSTYSAIAGLAVLTFIGLRRRK